MSEEIIVIGGGIGGLSAAIHLAAAGHPVRLLEQNAQLGGKMGELRREGFRWDTGPSVITMRQVLADLFHSAGRRLEDYLNLLPLNPLTRYFYPDGTVLDLTRELPPLLEQIRLLDQRDVEGYLGYLAYVARLYRISSPAFIFSDPPSMGQLLKADPRDLLHIDGLRTMQQAINSYVQSPQLRQLLGRFATYVGASPYRAPATLNVIAHVELNQGLWYPQGGIYRIAEALGRLASEMGVKLETAVRVQQIQVRDGRVAGVITADGRRLPAAAVVANLDVASVYEQMLPPALVAPRRLRRLQQAEPSCSGFVLLLGVQAHHPQLAHHNIFFSSDYQREFADIFERQRPPEEPTIYLAITAKTDFADAPPEMENWFVLVNVPATGAGWDWPMQQQAYRKLILDRLAENFHLDVRQQIVAEQIISPQDLEQFSGARRGALYGASSNARWAAFRRPHNRAAEVAGLYFAGGTTHPGGGVPMVMLSGRLAAQMASSDLETR